MSDKTYLDWPFFDDSHRALAASLDEWAVRNLADLHDTSDLDDTCRKLVARLGTDGWLRHAVPRAYGGVRDRLDSRSLCLVRETLARHAGLADFAFAMQGLGSGAIALHGSEELKQRYLPRVAAGDWIAAFALSEPDAGSDVAAMTTSAQLEGDHYRLDGTKTWISNGGIAHFYTIIARSGEAPGAKGLTAFVVDAGTAGLEVAERIDVTAPHPLATLRFHACRIPVANRLGEAGQGFKVAMETLDIFRASVAAAALGFARKALDEAVLRARGRRMFGQVLADFQLTQAAIADMGTTIDSSALLTYRAAWLRDVKGVRTTREAAMAKLAATEGAHQVIDRAVQLFGGLGVQSG
ncbi:MAG TPA: acyl-CoA dehydrogenase family protein, partial [Burkholderiales bacterium]|nr:acyl-CoA dehydrogenase family protein [Burkholderiales bacterium]